MIIESTGLHDDLYSALVKLARVERVVSAETSLELAVKYQGVRKNIPRHSH
ncbi:MAG: hypothetical protein GY850_03730 [bacterium]|nr:hypothetical protein [bacterium]